MIVTGQEITNITLDGVSETDIKYNDLQQLADIMNLGPGVIYISWRNTAVVGNINCLKLQENTSYELRPKSGWDVLSIIGTQTSSVQVVTR